MGLFRRRTPSFPEEAIVGQPHGERFLALGDLLDERRFTRTGLCILTSGEGFIVTGYALATETLETRLTRQTLEVTPEMLAAVRHRRAAS